MRRLRGFFRLVRCLVLMLHRLGAGLVGFSSFFGSFLVVLLGVPLVLHLVLGQRRRWRRGFRRRASSSAIRGWRWRWRWRTLLLRVCNHAKYQRTGQNDRIEFLYK